MAEGVIFTNLQALARKFGTDAAAVRKLLAAYAEASAAHGIRYRIVDAGDYVFRTPEAGRNRAVTLSPADSWVEHGYLLADYYRFGRSTADDETNYLFIVGGADVIPMPVLPQYITDPDYSDTDIDSDIPYAYLLGERTYPMLGTAEIFQYEQYFHTGRLPLAHDASLDDLDNADRLTNVYMAKLLEGYTAGEAFYMARQSFFDYNDGYFTPHQALTIVEFNLFGDPFLHVGVRREGAKAHPRAVKALAKGAVNAVVERKCVYEAAPASLLDRVRSAVDRNLSLIRAAVDRQLYEQLGVEPRSLSTVTRMKYGNGDEFYAFNYLQTDGTIKSCHTATADLNGNVTSIISTK